MVSNEKRKEKGTHRIGELTDFRYPTDPNDRIWKETSSSSASSISSLNVGISGQVGNVTPLLQVLQTALTHSERLEFIHNSPESRNNAYRVFLYFLELNDNVRPGQRVFDIYLNGKIKEKIFDILAGGSNYRHTVLNASSNWPINLTLGKASGSEYGPVCNAYEILEVVPWIKEPNETDSKRVFQNVIFFLPQTLRLSLTSTIFLLSVKEMLTVAEELMVENRGNKVLESWSGDPCMPSPWKGVECARLGGSIVITKL